MSYNYDSAQLGTTGDNLSKYTPSIINMGDNFNRYVISHAATLDEVNELIKKGVENFNNHTNNDLLAIPMFLTFAEHNQDGKDKFESVEIVISNPKNIQDNYYDSLTRSGYQSFKMANKTIDILTNIYGNGFDKDMVDVFNNVFTENNYMNSYIGRSYFENNVSNYISYKFADQAASLVAYYNLKLDYRINKHPDHVIETNYIHQKGLQKHSYFSPPESISRYKSLDNLLKNSENMAVSRAKYVASFIKDINTGKKVPYIFAEFTSPAQPYNRATIKLDDNFWNEHENGDVIVDNNISYYRFNKIYQNRLEGSL
ncbi:hypothetical protein LO80_06010 [Candidatus Francisella endociliophora]|uniref:Uncharacterized protein n=2 Tax=Candidatus Francisella endociliophora TaxID=653937 RepID=A0A097ERV4_9GAMM|nr:hypothetical protein LO80_06010 [Francisella sp. FSC1006]